MLGSHTPRGLEERAGSCKPKHERMCGWADGRAASRHERPRIVTQTTAAETKLCSMNAEFDQQKVLDGMISF